MQTETELKYSQAMLTDERIDALNREAQDQGIRGVPPHRYLARAIEAALIAKSVSLTAERDELKKQLALAIEDGFDPSALCADDMTVPKPSADLKVGDYVFTCRWGDGEPGDPWAVGFISEVSLEGHTPFVSLQNSHRGWRRAMKITEEQGHRICTLYPPAEPLDHQSRLAARAEAFALTGAVLSTTQPTPLKPEDA